MSAAREATRRLFLALWPSDELRGEIERETRQAAQHSGGRVIPAANLHITLAFLGAVPNYLASEAQASAKETVASFELVLGTLSWWPRQELLCLEPVSGAEALGEVVTSLHASLKRRGFELETRSLRAHMTLARDVRHAHDFKPIRRLHWQVHGVEVIESKLGSKGSTYTALTA